MVMPQKALSSGALSLGKRSYSLKSNMHHESIPGAMDRVTDTAMILPDVIEGITVSALTGGMVRVMVTVAAPGDTVIEDTGGWKEDMVRNIIIRFGIRVIITATVNGSPDIGL